MIRTLEQIIEWQGKPQAIRDNNGPEYITIRYGCLAQTLFDTIEQVHESATRWL